MDDPSGWRTLKINMFINVILGLLKGALAFSSGSAAMYASALNSLSNSASNLFSYLGIKKAARPADIDHPFGYGKEIYFWSFVASVFMLGFASMGAISQGYSQLIEKKAIYISPLMIIILVIALVHEIILLYGSHNFVGKFFCNCTLLDGIRQFKRYNNPVNKTIILQNASTIIATAISLVALIAAGFTSTYVIDGLASIAVGIIMGSMALALAFQLKDMIIGRSCNPATIQLIGDLAMKVPGVTDITDIKTMYMGSKCLLLNMEIQVESGLKVDEVDDVVNEVEKIIGGNLCNVKHINIEAVADDKVQGWKKAVSQKKTMALTEFV